MESSTELLKVLQRDIPLCEEPFGWIGAQVGLPQEEVLQRIRRLKEEKVIRQISPIYDAKRAGYDSALVAFKVEPSKLEEVAGIVSPYPGVSHNYEREDAFNLWFTVAVPSDAPYTLEELVESFARKGGVEEWAVLRTKRTFKIGVRLDFEDPLEREEPPAPKEEKSEGVSLSEEEKLLIRLSQEDLPLVKRPFKVLGEKAGLTEERVLEVLRELKEKGVMRRFSAILFHRRAGFKANGMAVWRVEEDRVEEAGRFLASFKAVSHCYERNTAPGWPYNLFSMVHGKKKEDVEKLCSLASKELGINDYKVLYSKREFKKKRVKLFDEAFYRWEL